MRDADQQFFMDAAIANNWLDTNPCDALFIGDMFFADILEKAGETPTSAHYAEALVAMGFSRAMADRFLAVLPGIVAEPLDFETRVIDMPLETRAAILHALCGGDVPGFEARLAPLREAYERNQSETAKALALGLLPFDMAALLAENDIKN